MTNATTKTAKTNATNAVKPNKADKQFLIIHPESGMVVGSKPKHHLAWQFAKGFQSEGEPMPTIAKVITKGYAMA